MTATSQDDDNNDDTDGHPLLNRTDSTRQTPSKKLAKMENLRQYFSSLPVVNLMASMMNYPQKHIKILDPEAGAGPLFTACVQRICSGTRQLPPNSIQVVAYETDDLLFDSISASMEQIGDVCRGMGVEFSGKLVKKDFIEDYAVAAAASSSSSNALSNDGYFTHIVLNPPYKKIDVSSKTYNTLRDARLQTTNMYSALIAISNNLLAPGGQMTFISPRSFCYDTYFHPFRKDFLKAMSPRRIHLFSSRTSESSSSSSSSSTPSPSSHDDRVLQENVIICARKKVTNHHDAVVSSSITPTGEIMARTHVKTSNIIFDGDPQMFIHIVPDEVGAQISQRMRSLPCTLQDIGMGVSTGKVVDFKIRDELRFSDQRDAVPLVRPFNITPDGTIRFPGHSKKHCNFIMQNQKSRKTLVANGNYILVKRYTTTEQKRRVVASIWTKDNYDSEMVGFEKRVNYFHSNGSGLADSSIARGLWAFLNSGMVDSYFRQFNGSTQVSTTDLMYLRYPSKRQLGVLGGSAVPGMSQDEIDRLVDDNLVIF